MRIKILMMQKNEDDLLRPWIAYHGAIAGFENLIVLDNGSTAPRTLDTLDWARSQGVPVNTQFAKKEDFIARGAMYAGLIQQLDAHDYTDIWLPMDCDEFLATEQDSRLCCDPGAIHAALEPYRRSPHPLMIAGAYNNHPRRPGHFTRAAQQKVFFAAGACAQIDPGFHTGHSRAGLPPLATPIVYIHFHFKPHALLVAHTKAKLANYTNDLSEAGLREHAAHQRLGHHTIAHLQQSKREYYASFDPAAYAPCPALTDAFRRIGQPLPFS